MNTSTIPSLPHISNDIPIVSSAGGQEYAYNDPNSPESIMKKTKEIHSQTMMDRMFDVNVSPYKQQEGFSTMVPKRNNNTIILFFFLFLLFIQLLYFKNNSKAFQYTLVLVFFTSIVLLLEQ
jgi:hypothetical protein